MVATEGYELSVLDRIALLDLLPEQGDYLTLKLVRELREELSFSEHEHEVLAFTKREDGGMQWQDVGLTKTFTPARKSRELIEEALKKADREKRLTPDHMHLYEVFMETEGS